LPTVENVDVINGAVDVDLTPCGVDFPIIATAGFTSGFVVAEPLVAKLLATGFETGSVLVPSNFAAPTDSFIFGFPEKIIASFLRAS
jgi:hypothetical protein